MRHREKCTTHNAGHFFMIIEAEWCRQVLEKTIGSSEKSICKRLRQTCVFFFRIPSMPTKTHTGYWRILAGRSKRGMRSWDRGWTEYTVSVVLSYICLWGVHGILNSFIHKGIGSTPGWGLGVINESGFYHSKVILWSKWMLAGAFV